MVKYLTSQKIHTVSFYSFYVLFLAEYVESRIPPLFYSVSGEIIQASEITGNEYSVMNWP